MLLGEIGKLAGRRLDIPFDDVAARVGGCDLEKPFSAHRSHASFVFDKLRSSYAIRLSRLSEVVRLRA